MEPYCEGKEVPRYILMTVEEQQKEYEEFKAKIYAELNNVSIENDAAAQRLIDYSKKTIENTNNFGNGTWSAKDFCKWYHGYEDSDFDDEGNVYSTYNKKSKWDWYEIGGRWSGLLVLKNGKRADKAKIKDVYFHGYSEKPECGDPVATIRDTQHPILKYIDNATAELSKEWDDVINGKSFYKPEYYLEKYKTKEDYIEQSLLFSTYAVITPDGEWHAAGEMGWFGCSSETAEEGNNFVNQYYDAFIKNANPEHYIIIVDCHI